jgi:hypothetical protein
MPRDGSGNYSLPAGNPVVTQTTISSSGWANPTLSDIASALTGSLARDGQSVPTANLPMGNFRHIGCTDGQNTNEYATVNQIQTAGLTLLGASAGTINTTKSATTGALTVNGNETINGELSVTDTSTSAKTVTITNTVAAGGASLTLVGNGSTTPSKTIHVQGGVFMIANDAYSANPLTLTDGGTLTVSSGITISSDERLKTDWAPAADDFLERMSRVLRGTFTRISSGERSAGVGAASLREVFPEAVLEGPDGYLSVAYGQAALVLALELTDEVLRLRALLEAAK